VDIHYLVDSPLALRGLTLESVSHGENEFGRYRLNQAASRTSNGDGSDPHATRPEYRTKPERRLIRSHGRDDVQNIGASWRITEAVDDDEVLRAANSLEDDLRT
jgi:hypothetical protein